MNRAELRALAEKATPGPWKQVGDTVVKEHVRTFRATGIVQASKRLNINGSLSQDCAFVAAADPQTVLALLDALKTAEQALQRYKSIGRADLHEYAKEALAAIASKVGAEE